MPSDARAYLDGISDSVWDGVANGVDKIAKAGSGLITDSVTDSLLGALGVDPNISALLKLLPEIDYSIIGVNAVRLLQGKIENGGDWNKTLKSNLGLTISGKTVFTGGDVKHVAVGNVKTTYKPFSLSAGGPYDPIDKGQKVQLTPRIDWPSDKSGVKNVTYTVVEGGGYVTVSSTGEVKAIKNANAPVTAKIEISADITCNGCDHYLVPDCKNVKKVTVDIIVNPKLYKVIFDANTGVGEYVVDGIGYEKTIDLPGEGEFEKEGYRFVCWNTEPDGSGTEFTDETPVTACITVYAQWVKDPLTVTYNANGGTVAPGTHVVGLGHSLSTTGRILPTPVRDGYKFLGWNTKVDGTGEWFTAGTVVSEDITVHAIWEEIILPKAITTTPTGGTSEPPVELGQISMFAQIITLLGLASSLFAMSTGFDRKRKA